MKKQYFVHLFMKRKLFISIILLLLSVFASNIDAQTLSVNGKIFAFRSPVKNASVTFIDIADTTKKYTGITNSQGEYDISVPTSVNDDVNNLPTKFELEQSYPNPFSSQAAIPYKLKKEADVQVTIYDILGRSVRVFNAGVQNIGAHSILWDGRNNFGQKVSSGIYFYKLQAGNESQVKKMIFNETGKGLVSLPKMYSAPVQEYSPELQKSSESTNYKVRVENTSSTSPYIITQEYNGITVNKDTSISFTVSNYIPVATVDTDSTLQIIRGFGAANIIGWRPDMTDSEIETAFNNGDGNIGFSILRLRIPPDSASWSSNISTAKKAYDKGALIIATPWSPPASMKTNNNLVGGELKESSYADYALHLKKFGDYMAANGVNLYGISIQNEPDITVSYESCDWNSNQFIKFLRENASLIGYRIIAPESFQFRRQLSDPILNDSAACANLDIVGGHIYGGGLGVYPLAEAKGKEVWMTEYLINSGSSASDPTLDTGWKGAIQTAKSISDCMMSDMSAYVYWYIVRYYGPLGDGTNSSTKGSVTRKGYVMSQFARFVRPGYYRVYNDNYTQSLGIGAYVTVYKDPATSKIVIIGVNTSDTPEDQVIRIPGSLTKTFSTYTSSSSKNCQKGSDVIMIDGSFKFTFEASSITTFVLQ